VSRLLDASIFRDGRLRFVNGILDRLIPEAKRTRKANRAEPQPAVSED